MATKYIVGSVAASFAFAYACGVYVADRKVLGGEIRCHAMPHPPCQHPHAPVISCCSSSPVEAEQGTV